MYSSLIFSLYSDYQRNWMTAKMGVQFLHKEYTVSLLNELDDTKSCFQLIKTMTKCAKKTPIGWHNYRSGPGYLKLC